MLSRYCHPRKIEKGKNPIVTDGGAMQRRTGETFVRWAKQINLEIHEEKSAWGHYDLVVSPSPPKVVHTHQLSRL